METTTIAPKNWTSFTNLKGRALSKGGVILDDDAFQTTIRLPRARRLVTTVLFVLGIITAVFGVGLFLLLLAGLNHLLTPKEILVLKKPTATEW